MIVGSHLRLSSFFFLARERELGDRIGLGIWKAIHFWVVVK